MDKLRGTGSTFSTSGKRWMPFRFSPKIARQNGKRYRQMQAGLIQPMTKDEMRDLGEQAVSGALPRSKPNR